MCIKMEKYVSTGFKFFVPYDGPTGNREVTIQGRVTLSPIMVVMIFLCWVMLGILLSDVGIWKGRHLSVGDNKESSVFCWPNPYTGISMGWIWHEGKILFPREGMTYLCCSLLRCTVRQRNFLCFSVDNCVICTLYEILLVTGFLVQPEGIMEKSYTSQTKGSPCSRKEEGFEWDTQ